MKNQPDINWYQPQRQSPSGLVIIVYKAGILILKAVWPLLLIVLFREKKRDFDPFESLLIIIPAFILIRSVLDFFYFKFYIEGKDLVIKKGFISKKTITLPLDRIQAVHIERSVIHQLFNVARIKIDTAGSEKTEATIDAISVAKAELLKTFLLDSYPNEGTTDISIEKPKEIPLLTLSVMDVLKLGVSANHIQTFFIVLAFFISMVQNLEEIFGNRIILFVKESSSTIGYSLNAFLLVAIAVLLVSVFVSIIRILLVYFDFTLYKTAQGFKLKTGLLNSRQNFVPYSKIQFISWRANLFRRKIGLYTLEFHQALSDVVTRRQKVKVPVTQAIYIDSILANYHEDFRKSADSVHEIHPVYPFRRMLIWAIPISIVLASVAFIWWKWNALAFFLLIPYIFISATIYRNNFRLYISFDALQLHSGVWGREIKILRWQKIQVVELRQSIYQRSRNLATIELLSAGGSITIPYIHLELANRIQNYALYKVESTNAPWM